MRTMTRALTGLVIAVVASTLIGSASAQATAPGENGADHVSPVLQSRSHPRRHLHDRSRRHRRAPDHAPWERRPETPSRTGLRTLDGSRFSGRWKARGPRSSRSGPTARTSRNSSTDPNVNEQFPAWSPSGKRIIFARFDDATGVAAVFVMRADGTQGPPNHAQQIVDWGADFMLPDGTRLVFSGGNAGTNKAAVFTIRLNGTDTHRLTPPGRCTPGAWTGRRTANGFCFGPTAGQDRTGNLYLIHPDGTGLHLVTHTFGGFPEWGCVLVLSRRVDDHRRPQHHRRDEL